MNRRHLRPLILSLLCLFPIASQATAEEEPPKLLGQCTIAQLSETPYVEWFDSGFDAYTPDVATFEALRQINFEDVEISIFFGTWCGDSRREVPRFLKLLDSLDVPESQIKLIAVDNKEPLHKRSPDGEEAGLEVYRVPTIVVSRQGKELSRLVEHPALSLERDFLAILESEGYQPSYASYPVVQDWIEQGLLSDPNISADGLANQVRSLVSSEWELYSAGRVLWSRGDVEEAAKLLAVNCSLHWESASCHARLAEAQIRAGHLEQARKSTLRALRRNEDPDEIETLVDLVERTIVVE